jgi:hypothetical protein
MKKQKSYFDLSSMPHLQQRILQLQAKAQASQSRTDSARQRRLAKKRRQEERTAALVQKRRKDRVNERIQREKSNVLKCAKCKRYKSVHLFCLWFVHHRKSSWAVCRECFKKPSTKRWAAFKWRNCHWLFKENSHYRDYRSVPFFESMPTLKTRMKVSR